jgi:hypothetical protein
MATYYAGRRLVKTFSTLSANKRVRIDWKVFEEWRDIDEGTAARCGVEGTCTFEVASGISEKAMSTLKEVAGGQLGLKDVFSLKYEVATSIGREVNWEVSSTSTRTFRIQPPICGRCALTVYQLFRVYEFTHFEKKWFSFNAEKWARLAERTFEERVNKYDGLPDTVETDPICNCPDSPRAPEFDGLMHLDFGAIGLRVPYRLTQTGLEVQIDRSVVKFDSGDLPRMMRSLDDGLDIEVAAELIPEPLRFLAKVEAEKMTGRMLKFAEESVEVGVLSYVEMDVLSGVAATSMPGGA